MRILIDVQTLYTHERNRGIGIYTYNWLKKIIQHDDAHRFFLMRKKDDHWQFTFISKYLDFDSRINEDKFWENFNLEEFIKINKVDLVHFTSPFMFDIEVPDLEKVKVKKSYLVYDLIPLAMKEHFYNTWPTDIQKVYNKRCELIKSADLILTISQATKGDLESMLNIDSNKINVIYASTNEELFESSRQGNERKILENELGLTSPFIYSLTGYDVRKNNRGLMAAFAEVSKINSDVKLVVSGIKENVEKEEFIQFAKQKGIDVNKIMFLGFVSNDCLLALYKECKVFVFPSLYEGFGLPVLEAMRVGAPVITTNCSSLVEVAADAALLVNPFDNTELANAIITILHDEQLAKNFSKAGLEQSKKFNWNKTTRSSLESFTQLFSYPIVRSTTNKPMLAYMSPLNPQTSGISDYSEELLIYLKDHFEIKLFVNGIVPSNQFLNNSFEILDINTHSFLLESIKYRLYHIGNNEIHDWIYNNLILYPGIVVLHDLNLFGFYMYTTFLRGYKEKLRSELTYGYGLEGFEAGNQLLLNGTYPDSQKFPLFNKVVDLSTSVIVHSEWSKETISLGNASYTGEIKVIQHGFIIEEEKEEDSKINTKIKLNFDLSKLTIGVFGNVIPNKRLDVIIKCFSELLKTNPNTELYIVGHAEKDIKQQLLKLSKLLKVDKNIKFIESPEIDEFKQYIKACDLCINLRWPTMGETSGTLTRALGYGVPCIVSNVGSYMEYPDDIVWKVDVDEYEEELLLAYLIELCNNPKMLEEMGELSKEFIRLHHDFGKVSKQYLDFINEHFAKI